MYPRAFLERVLSHLEAHGQIGPRARARVWSLLNHGLHPEQVLIGTGIVTVADYQEILKELTGFTVEAATSSPVFPEGLTREEARRFLVLPLSREGERVRMGYVEPWNQATRAWIQSKATENGWEEEPVILLFSTWRRLYPTPVRSQKPQLRTVRTLRPQEERARPLQTWLTDAFHPRPRVSTDPRVMHHAVPGAELPALIRRLRREAQDGAFTVELKATEHGPVVLIHHTQTEAQDHPADWLRTLSPHDALPAGLSLLIGVDPVFTRLMQGASSGSEADLEVWRDEDELRISRPRPEIREALVHAVLAGKTALVHLPHPEEPWWQTVQEAGIPVRIIHKQQLPAGESWVSYQL